MTKINHDKIRSAVRENYSKVASIEVDCCSGSTGCCGSAKSADFAEIASAMHNYLQITTTTDTQAKAQEIARALLEKNLAACVQISGAISSWYWWQGKLVNTPEWRLSIKAPVRFYAQIETLIKALHFYELPEIMAVPIVAGSVEYLAWLETAGQQDGVGILRQTQDSEKEQEK